MRRKRLVYGRGYFDLPLETERLKKAAQVWRSMMERCYSVRVKSPNPNAVKATVCEEWLLFSSFYEWYTEQNPPRGWHLDKDLLSNGDKVYSPSTCVFIPREVNSFLNTPSKRTKRDLPMGVSHSTNGRFLAQCNNPKLKRTECLGSFPTKEEAHQAWKRKKQEWASMHAEKLTDGRAKRALLARFL